MKSLQNNKGIVIAIVVFGLAIGIYNYFFKPNPALIETGASAVNAGSDVIELNSNLKKVTLSTTLFNTTAYKNLQDFSVEIPIQPQGRHNPFSAIGSDSGQTVPSPQSSSIKVK